VEFPVHGIYPAMLSPMNPDESPNLAAIPTLVEHVLGAGVHGLFVVGTHGEAYALTTQEREAVIAAYVQAVAGHVPVLAGVGAVTTRAALTNLRAAEEAGADGVSVVTPYFISPGQDELYDHFRAIAEATDLPVLLYNLPGRTHVSIAPQTMARLARIDNIVGVKDSSGDLNNTIDYIRLMPDDTAVMNGNDGLICAALSAGATGAVAATADIVPGLLVSLYKSFCAGDLEAAWEAQFRLMPLRRCFALNTVPDPIKEAARTIGLPVGPTARPVGPMSGEAKQRLQQVLGELGLAVQEKGGRAFFQSGTGQSTHRFP